MSSYVGLKAIPKGHQPGSGPVALIITKNRSLARQLRIKVLEYGRGTLDVGPRGPVAPGLQVGIVVGSGDKSKLDRNASREAEKVIAESVQATVIVGTLDKVNYIPYAPFPQ